jgi:hypothetical protein
MAAQERSFGIPVTLEAKRFDIAWIFGYLTKGSPSAFV